MTTVDAARLQGEKLARQQKQLDLSKFNSDAERKAAQAAWHAEQERIRNQKR